MANNKKTTEAQVRASRAYEERNPEKTKITRYRSTARTFVRHYAKEEDMDKLMKLFREENPNSIKKEDD